MGEVVDLEAWRTRCARHAAPQAVARPAPLQLRIALVAMLGLPLMVTLAAMAA